MKIHEYQAKELFRAAGMPVQPGDIASSVDEAVAVATKMGYPVVVKAQVHAGGRGKAGGVKLAKDAEEIRAKATAILGMDIKGSIVRKVLIAPAAEIKSECYVGLIMDRASKRPVFMVSKAGGIDIEEVAATTPEKIIKLSVNPLLGLTDHQARYLSYALYTDPAHVKQCMVVLKCLYKAFWDNDCSLAEVNPLIVDGNDQVLAIDAKINLDDNGLYRHPNVAAMRDLGEEDPAENEAREGDLSFVKLNGTIGCIVNGAGLAMATMDMTKYYGGEPANFLDIGGSSNPKKVVKAMSIILRDPNVKVIAFNIFGGITRCDDVANGLVAAINEMKPSVPIIVRLTGTNEEAGREILKQVGISAYSTMNDVMQEAVNLAQSR